MQVNITGRHFDASTDLQANIEAQVASLVKFNDRITGAHVVLDKQPNDIRSAHADLTIAGAGVISATAEAETMHKAIDEMFERLTRILKKDNERVKDHRAPPVDRVVDV
ncbi:MAG TPA: ribosome-associated translation inhibitor RaiA [Fibrobacteria bacterium]|nr:ribosome-associated translation inhibitor RaiA [Fibrobacteria bacterium]HOX52199.1 ribosome-associated translation inhibitor RaiA [Fibrobacteria bacterium]